jgi:DNA-binding IclR family transcriptional regulator
MSEAGLHTKEAKISSSALAIVVLRLLADRGEPLGVNAIARELDIMPSTCLHILRALEDERLLDVEDAGKRYSIGLSLAELARDALSQHMLLSRSQRELNALAEAFAVTCSMNQLVDADRMLIVGVARGRSIFSVNAEIGDTYPAFASATGRVLAAWSGLSRGALRARFDRVQWDNPPTFKAWLGEVEQARERGYAIDRGNYGRGYTAICRPGASRRDRQSYFRGGRFQ